MAARRYERDFEKLSISEPTVSNDSFYPLKMTEDRRTEQYVKFAKVMIIFQGPVNNERSEALSKLRKSFKIAGRLFSDDSYKFETSRSCVERGIDEYHEFFKRKVKRACQELMNVIVIDQSLSNVLQMQYYCSLAQMWQYVILPYPPVVDTTCEVDVKNTVAAEFGKFSQRRVERPNYFKHLFCGWFLHDVDSHELRGEAILYVQDCFDNIRDFREIYTNVCKGEDFREFYNMLDRYQDLAYCVTKIFQNPLDTLNYMSTRHFKKHYGSMSKLYIVGFLISPHMIAARVKLTHDQRNLWDMPDDLEAKNTPKVFASELLKSAKIRNTEEIAYRGVKSNRTIVAGNVIYEPTKVIHPWGVSRSCHIVLGQAKEAGQEYLNYDVQFAVPRERIAVQKYSEQVRPYELERCEVRKIGRYWFIYLKETIVVNGFFATCPAVDNCQI